MNAILKEIQQRLMFRMLATYVVLKNMNVFHFTNMCTLMLSLMVTLWYNQQLLYPSLSLKLCLSLCQSRSFPHFHPFVRFIWHVYGFIFVVRVLETYKVFSTLYNKISTKAFCFSGVIWVGNIINHCLLYLMVFVRSFAC